MRQLPAAQQDAIAALIEAELADNERWATAFAQSQDRLADLADEALQDHRCAQRFVLFRAQEQQQRAAGQHMPPA